MGLKVISNVMHAHQIHLYSGENIKISKGKVLSYNGTTHRCPAGRWINLGEGVSDGGCLVRVDR